MRYRRSLYGLVPTQYQHRIKWTKIQQQKIRLSLELFDNYSSESGHKKFDQMVIWSQFDLKS